LAYRDEFVFTDCSIRTYYDLLELLYVDRDINASINVKRVGLELFPTIKRSRGKVVVTITATASTKGGSPGSSSECQKPTLTACGSVGSSQAQDLLLLRRGSIITTSAGTQQASGNGGNITINTPFIITLPDENSDISANAFSGSGGRVSINATNLFNIAPLSRQDLEKLLGTNDPKKLDPQQLPTNDITAISQTNPDLSGTVQINTPNIDPSRGLVTLPTITEVAPRLVSSSCAAFNEIAGGSTFTITGRGGLPPSPDEPLTSDVVWSDTRLPTTTAQHQHKTHAAKPKPQPIAIVPATGWVFNGKGEVTLISSATNATTLNTPTSCPAR